MPTRSIVRTRTGWGPKPSLAVLALGLGLWAPAHGQAMDKAQEYCSAFQARSLDFKDRSVRLLSSQFRAAGPFAQPPGPGGPATTISLPAHCDVFGIMQERIGLKGQKYAIRFHMRLPINWNQRFFYQGGGT